MQAWRHWGGIVKRARGHEKENRGSGASGDIGVGVVMAVHFQTSRPPGEFGCFGHALFVYIRGAAQFEPWVVKDDEEDFTCKFSVWRGYDRSIEAIEPVGSFAAVWNSGEK